LPSLCEDDLPLFSLKYLLYIKLHRAIMSKLFFKLRIGLALEQEGRHLPALCSLQPTKAVYVATGSQTEKLKLYSWTRVGHCIKPLIGQWSYAADSSAAAVFLFIKLTDRLLKQNRKKLCWEKLQPAAAH
jgi:hypothetical protein